MKIFILALSLLAFPPLLSGANPNPTNAYRYGNAPTPAALKRQASRGHVSFGGEALLWRAAGPGPGYVRLTQGPLATLILDRPVYDLGFRVSAGYQLPSCWEVKGSYLLFESRFSDTRTDEIGSPETLIPTFLASADPPIQAFAGANVSNKLQVADAALWLPLIRGRCYQFNAFGGARYVEQREREHYHYLDFDTVETFAIQNTHFCGVGPLVGITASLSPIPFGCFNGFALQSSIGTGFIIARRNLFFENTDNFAATMQNQIKYPRATLGAPVFDVGVRVSYSRQVCGWTLLAHAAYELQWYQNASERFVNASSGSSFPQPQVSGIGYFGWSFGFKLTH